MKGTRALTIFVLTLAFLTIVPVNVFAWGYINTTITGTPNPHRVNENGHQEIIVENIDSFPVRGVLIKVVPTTDPGIKIKRIIVDLNGTAVCHSKSTVNCSVGDINPGDKVTARMYFQGKKPGEYYTSWTVIHDGIHSSFGTGTTIVPRK